MPLVHDLIAGINIPTMIAAVLLVLAVLLAIRIGRALMLAAVFGALAGGVSLGLGGSLGTAGIHAAMGFGVAAATLFLIGVTRRLAMWVLITAAGVGALLLWGVATS